jgi:hypothetical protein
MEALQSSETSHLANLRLLGYLLGLIFYPEDGGSIFF